MPTPVKVSSLPAVTSIDTSLYLVANVSGVTSRVGLGLVVTLIEDNLGAEASNAAAQAVSAATVAVSAAADAVAAAAAATGFIAVTSVSSSVDDTYEGNAPYQFEVGRFYNITLHQTNTGINPAIRLNRTDGYRSMRQGDGTASPAGFFPASVGLGFYDDGTVLRLIARGETDDVREFGPKTVININGQKTTFQSSVSSANGYAWMWAIPQASSVSAGTLNFYVGTEEAAPDLKMQINQKGVRALDGAFIDRRARELYGVFNPQPDSDSYQEHISQLISPYNELGHEPINVSVTTPYFPSGFNIGRPLRITTSLAQINFQNFPRNIQLFVNTESGGTAILNAGYTTSVWANTSTTCLMMEPNSHALVVKEQNQIRILSSEGLIYATSVTDPTYGYKWAFLGQSWAERESRSAIGGIQRRLYEMVAAGVPISNPSVFVVQKTAAGASALIDGAPTAVSNYWWNVSASAPGPNAIAFVSAVAATSLWGPALSDVIVMYGLNDLSIFTSSGYSNPTSWTASQVALQAYIRSALTLPNLRFWISPLPTQQLGTFDENKWFAMRDAQLAVISADPTGLTFRGAEYYDYPRPYVAAEGDDRHHAYVYQADHGARIASHIMNYVVSASVYTGPVLVSASRTAEKTFVATFFRNGGLAFGRPIVPGAIAVSPNDDYFATPLTIESGSHTWGVVSVAGVDYDQLTVSLETDATTMRLMYPYGSGYELQNTNLQLRALDPVTSRWWPVQVPRNL